MEVKQQSRKFGANSENSDILAFGVYFCLLFFSSFCCGCHVFQMFLLENALVVVYIYMYIENEMNFFPVSRLALYTHCARVHRLP